MAEGLRDWMAPPKGVIVVEPEKAACVEAMLAQEKSVRKPVRIPGDLQTTAEMLSCGEASAPAVAILRRHGARVVTVSEAELEEGPSLVRADGGPVTTPSGAAGLAGLRRVLKGGIGARFGLDADSRVLAIISEADPERLSAA
jgi:diaminopropionate ammonia-lyase